MNKLLKKLHDHIVYDDAAHMILLICLSICVGIILLPK